MTARPLTLLCALVGLSFALITAACGVGQKRSGCVGRAEFD